MTAACAPLYQFRRYDQHYQKEHNDAEKLHPEKPPFSAKCLHFYLVQAS